MLGVKLFQLLSLISSYLFGESYVKRLTGANFDTVRNTNKFVLVKFYKPDCRHCRAIASEYEKAATMMNQLKSNILLTEVDVDEEYELATRYEIFKYPTIILFKQGRPVQLGIVDNADDILRVLDRRTGYTVKNIESEIEFNALVEKEERIALIFPQDKSDKKWEVFNEVATEIDIPFVTSNLDDIKKRFISSEGGTIFFHRKVDQFVTSFDEKLSVKGLTDWINWNFNPSFIEYTKENKKYIFNDQDTIQFLFFTKFSDEKFEANSKLLRDFFATKQIRMQVVLVDVEKTDSAKFMKLFKVTEAETPIYMILLNHKNVRRVKAKEKSAFNQDVLQKFTDDVIQNRLGEYLESEEVSSDWDQHPVKVLVGRNFRQVISDNTKVHLVLFYADWCGLCKSMHPIWEELGEEFKDTGVVIAKIDATKNDTEEVRIDAFPTVYLFSKGGEKKIEFKSHNRKFSELKSFINENLDISNKEEL